MAEVAEIYRCEVCGIVAKVLEAGAGTMVCCNQPMTLQEDYEEDQS